MVEILLFQICMFLNEIKQITIVFHYINCFLLYVDYIKFVTEVFKMILRKECATNLITKIRVLFFGETRNTNCFLLYVDYIKFVTEVFKMILRKEGATDLITRIRALFFWRNKEAKSLIVS